MSEAIAEGAACRANFSGPGRRRRRNVAIGAAVIGVALFAGLIATHAGAYVRLLVALPFMMAAISGLQVTRNTCVAHAAAGTFEHEDFSTTKVDAALAEASRKVAKTIYRDGVLVGLLTAALGFGSAFVLA
ncbi:MAG: hypothetical protein U0228_02265 [Myxococcaceae bacterium]